MRVFVNAASLFVLNVAHHNRFRNVALLALATVEREGGLGSGRSSQDFSGFADEWHPDEKKGPEFPRPMTLRSTVRVLQ